MGSLSYFIGWMVVGAVVILGINIIQKKCLQKRRLPTDSALYWRSSLAIILASMGIVSYLIPVSDYNVKYEAVSLENALRLDTFQIYHWTRVPERHFVEGLYSREELDTLEGDYNDLRLWMKENAGTLHDRIDAYDVIEEDLLRVPLPKSSFGNAELTFVRESYINGIVAYNHDVRNYKTILKRRESLVGMSLIFNYLMPIFLLIAMALQLSVVFWEYHRK